MFKAYAYSFSFLAAVVLAMLQGCVDEENKPSSFQMQMNKDASEYMKNVPGFEDCVMAVVSPPRFNGFVVIRCPTGSVAALH